MRTFSYTPHTCTIVVMMDFFIWWTYVRACILDCLGGNKIVCLVLVENIGRSFLAVTVCYLWQSKDLLTRWLECLPEWCWPKRESCCIISYKCLHLTFTYTESCADCEHSSGYSSVENRTIRIVINTKNIVLEGTIHQNIWISNSFISSSVSRFLFRQHVISFSTQCILGTDFTPTKLQICKARTFFGLRTQDILILLSSLQQSVAFLLSFSRVRKISESFAMSVRMSIRPPFRMEQLGSHWTDLNEIWYFSIFRKSVEKF